MNGTIIIFPYAYSLWHIALTVSLQVLAVARKVFTHGWNSSVSSRVPSFMQALRDTLLGLIPKTEQEVGPFQAPVLPACADFEKKMELFGFLELSGDAGVLLSAAGEISARFLEAR